MSIRGSLIVLALASGLVSCGESETSTATVVQTVTQSGPTPPPGATESTAEEPTAPPPAAPVANLPDGAVAVQGRYRMRVARATNNAYVASGDEGEEGADRLWVAETVCEDVCRVQLRRQLKTGAYEEAALERGDDARSFGETTKVQAKYCVSSELSTGPATKRISLRVTATEQRAGQQTATRIDGYFSVRQICQRGSLRLGGRATVKFRGALDG